MKIPIFPLNGAIMFPQTNLPLNIFENKYIDMIDYCLSNERLLGMVQHKPNNELFDVGCYGKITVFNELPDKRYLINLEGVNCFKIVKEVDTDYKFKVCEIEVFNDFMNDKLKDSLKTKVLDCFKKYSDLKKININLKDFSELNIVDLLKLIVMVSPFEVNLKQMFLELKSNNELYESVLSALQIELASKEGVTSVN